MRSDGERNALSEVLHHIDLAENFASGYDFVRFRDDLMRIYAVTRCLEIISEASRRLTDELKARHPDIPWQQIAGAGNIYRHDYEDVAATRVWDTVRIALPPLRTVVEQEMGKG
jgi:uncharacterized protein with HEPN domain